MSSQIVKHRILVNLNDQDLKDLERIRGKVPVSEFVRELIRSHVKKADKVRLTYAAKKRRHLLKAVAKS